jgi:2-polyprenyl-6-methoxyphenol hydroxylase-like FAD-dependent oxidoreductase
MNPTSPHPHGIIVGGGIGGMALAAALERVGVSCEVHEQAEELREVGAGITLWSNALIALKRLGAATQVMAFGSREDRIEVRTPCGKVLAALPAARAVRRFGVPGCVCVHRSDLLRELIVLSRTNRVHLRSRCTNIHQEDNRIIAHFGDGQSREGDFLVGADGLHSVVRTHLLGQAPPRYAGYTCWRGVATLDLPVPLPPHCAFETWGCGRRFSIHPCGSGRFFWFGTRNQAAHENDGPRGRQADVQALFSSWHEPIPSVIAATTEILRNDILDRPPARVWGRGRMTLLGDAAHPTTPNLGQGACQALEDAVVLADQLRREPKIEGALRSYESLRRPRANRITTESFLFGRISQSENRLLGWLINRAIRFAPPAVSWWSMERFLHTQLPVLLIDNPSSHPMAREVKSEASGRGTQATL